jgi:AcrR family transcriptional regulator
MDGSKLNRSQSKYYNTACLLDEALIALLEEKNYEYITVKEICEKANVNRSTFYLHYETMGDLLAECIQYTGSKILAKYKQDSLIDKAQINTSPKENLLLFTPEYLLPYLEFVKENKRVYMAAVTQPAIMKSDKIAKYLYAEFFGPILTRFGVPENERKYRMTFYLSGISAVIIEWIKNGYKEPIEDMAKVLMNCLNI